MDKAIASCRAIPSAVGGVELDLSVAFSRSESSAASLVDEAVASCRFTRSVAGGVELDPGSAATHVVDEAVTSCRSCAGTDELDIAAVVSRSGLRSTGGLDETIASCHPPMRAKLSSISPPSFLERERSQQVGWIRPSPLAERSRPVRTELSSISPPPFPDRNRPQPVGSVLLVLLDCIDFLQAPVGSAAPIPSIPVVDQQSCHWPSAARQPDQRNRQISQVARQKRKARPLEGSPICGQQLHYRLKSPFQPARL